MNTPIGAFNPRTLIPGAIIAIAVFFASVFFFLNSGEKKISVKIFLLYSLATLVLFAIIALTGFIQIENPLKFFIGTQIGMLGLGVVHTIALSYLNKDHDDSVFWHEIIFTIYVVLLGGFVYTFILMRISEQGYEVFLVSTLLAFLTPFFVYKSFCYLVSIPAQEYEKWYFPVDKNFDEELDEEDFDDKKTLIVKLEINGHKTGDDKIIVTQGLAPIRYEFGEYFATYLMEWNERKPGEQIEYLDNYGQPQGWNFFVKPKWYQSPRYLNPKLTIAENELQGKETVVCERV